MMPCISWRSSTEPLDDGNRPFQVLATLRAGFGKRFKDTPESKDDPVLRLYGGQDAQILRAMAIAASEDTSAAYRELADAAERHRYVDVFTDACEYESWATLTKEGTP